MKITNKTTKIIGIAGESILPNESADIPDSEANSSVVQHLAKIGKVVIGDGSRYSGWNWQRQG